jgi:glutathione S-transferase
MNPMPAERPLLYTYRRCPYAMRARMALLVAGIPFDAHEIVLRDKPAGLLSASPKGTVPVLVLPVGAVSDQSWDIVRWALTHPDAQPEAHAWWSTAESDDNRRLLDLNDNDFKHHLDRYKYPERFADLKPEDKAGWQGEHRSQAVKRLLEPLEQRLQQAPFLGGNTPCATDFGIFPFVRQFAAVNEAWFAGLPVPQVQKWLQGWLGSPLFQRCMAKWPSNTRQAYPAGSSGLTIAHFLP